MLDVRFATLADTDRLMAFMHAHWRADHILSRNRELFLYDFRDGDRLNLAIACRGDDEIVGLFGFMKYNHLDIPDLAGSLWKVRDDAGEPMLGLRLRRFVMNEVPHRYFAAPGAGLQTRAIYHLIGMQWIEMDQYFLINPDLSRRRLARAEPAPGPLPTPRQFPGYCASEVVDPQALKGFPFLARPEFGPLKDWGYVRKRFFEHPIYRYRSFLFHCGSEPVAIVVCREATHEGSAALRIVDFYGDEHHMPAVIAHLAALIRQDGHEYLDFVCSGFDPAVMSAAGLRQLDFASRDTVIPNYFEPFVQSNVRVYAVADRRDDIRPRLCRADGDQDRPNFDRPTSVHSHRPLRRVANA